MLQIKPIENFPSFCFLLFLHFFNFRKPWPFAHYTNNRYSCMKCPFYFSISYFIFGWKCCYFRVLWENAVTFVFIEKMGCFNLVGCAAVEVAGEREHVGINGVVTWPLDTRRFLEENTTVLLLAQQRTSRRDPLNGFNRYTGGWNISNKHYWAVSSLILTLI